MIATVIEKTLDVPNSLPLFGLSQEIFRAVALGYYTAGIECTENDPPTHAGIHRWGRANRVLRDFVIPLGWEKFNYKNIPLTIHPDRKLAIVVLNGNSSTGLIDLEPRTRRPKGLCMEAIIGNNAQLQLDMFVINEDVNNEPQFEWQVWILLIYQCKEKIRMELSLPLKIDGSGNIIAWRDRIILDTADFGALLLSSLSEQDFAPEPEVAVVRRI